MQIGYKRFQFLALDTHHKENQDVIFSSMKRAIMIFSSIKRTITIFSSMKRTNMIFSSMKRTIRYFHP